MSQYFDFKVGFSLGRFIRYKTFGQSESSSFSGSRLSKVFILSNFYGEEREGGGTIFEIKIFFYLKGTVGSCDFH